MEEPSITELSAEILNEALEIMNFKYLSLEDKLALICQRNLKRGLEIGSQANN